MSFERLESESVWEGKMIRAGIERYRYRSGEEVAREKVWHPGAVAILAVDETQVWLTRQPREVVGQQDSLEVPAGKRDVDGEPPLETAKRELAEEIGKHAAHWEEVLAFHTSPGFSDERIQLYLASDLSEAPGGAQADEDEQIEIIPWPLQRLDDAIAECEDAKSLVALLWLKAGGQRASE